MRGRAGRIEKLLGTTLQPLVISRFCAANSLGAGSGAMLQALRERHSGLKPCDFETARVDTYVGAIPGIDDVRLRSDLRDFDCRNNRIAQLCLEQDGFTEEVAGARERYGAGRIGFFLGTSTSGLHTTELAFRHRDPKTGALPTGYRYAETQNSYSVGEFVRRYLGLSGLGFVVSSACSSSAKVFGSAARMIAAGVCDAAVVGGADSLCLMTLYGFHSLGLTSREPCRPFDADRDGISIGEGAGFALIERADRAKAGTVLLLGVGESSDAYHMSTPHPQGLGAKTSMREALDSAGLEASDIDYINLHGTATKSNDASEDKAVFEVFGTRTPCSSTKGATGHLLGAAGITEAVVSMLAIEHGFLPGGAHTKSVDPELKSNYLLASRKAKITRVLSNSFGFGGSNCSLIFGAAS